VNPRRACQTPFGEGFIGPRSGRAICFIYPERRATNVLEVDFKPLDYSGTRYVNWMAKADLAVRKRRCRACGEAGHDRRTCATRKARAL
jgi:hypothetical protein